MNRFATFETFKHLSDQENSYMVEGDDLRALQLVLFEMMQDIHDVCQRNGIGYMLFSGSCLGAYRHGGFIPWDDDLDIAMTREDYVKFREVFERELGKDYVLHTPEDTQNYGLAFPRIRKRGTILKSRDDLKSEEECGVYIDLFIWESVPDNPILRGLHGFGSLAIGLLYSCRRFAWFGDTYLKLTEGDSQAGRVFRAKIVLGNIVSFASLDGWTRAWYKFNSLCKNASSRCLTIPAARKKYFGETVPRETLLPFAGIEFEGITLMGPNDAPAYLKNALGKDYMTPPPPEKREKHFVFDFDLGEPASEILKRHGESSGQPREESE